MIGIKNINLAFERVLLDQGELCIRNGLLTGIIGESGCGKTSLLQMIGLLSNSGTMKYTFDGISIDDLSSREKMQILREDICFVMQDIYLFEDLTIYEIMKLYASFVNREINEDDVYKCLHQVNLHLDIHTYTKTLSGGEKQRLCIACGLLKNAKLFIFDEPFANLDKENIKRVLTIIQELAYQDNKMVVISTHDQQIYKQFDVIYQFKNQRLVLQKDATHKDVKLESQHNPFHFSSLMSYVHLYYRKHKWKSIGLSSLMAIIIALLVVIGNFNQSFQQTNGTSLLSLMKNEVVIIRKDVKVISPKEQAVLKSKLSEYEVYNAYSFRDFQNMTVNSYLDNEKESFQVLEVFNEEGMLNNQKTDKPIFMTYSMYRSLHNERSYVINNSLSIKASHILNPSEDTMSGIYIPYEDMEQYLKDIGIDIGLMETACLKVPINSVEDIAIIEKLMTDEYQMLHDEFIGVSIQAAKIFEKSTVNIFVFITLFVLFIYKIFDVIKVKKDLILFKMSGIHNYDLCLMKAYQEGILFICNIIISIILMATISKVLNILVFESFMDMMFLIVIWNIGMYIVLLIIYFVMISLFSPAAMLRKNKDD